MHRVIPTIIMLTVAFAGGCATDRERGLRSTIAERADVSQSALAAPSAQPPTSPDHALNDEAEHREVRTQFTSYHDDTPPEHTPTESAIPSDASVAPSSQLTLATLEGIALANNPTLTQAAAQVRGARAAAYQAGLYPNPIVGYEGEFDTIGLGTDESWNGGFVAQEFVTGGKLRLSRAKWCQRAKIAATNQRAQQQRVLNDVRTQFYRTLAAQELVNVARQLVANGEDNLQTHREMLNLGQTNGAGLLRAEVDLQRDRLNLTQAENELDHAWRTLTSFIGVSELPRSPLAGSLESRETPLEWDSALHRLLSASPELQAAWQKIQHDKITIDRERVEPIPNVIADVTTIHSPVADSTQTTVNLGLPLPVFDQNRGTVRQAQADLTQSRAEAHRLELELRNRLATQYRVYRTAWQRVHDYQTTMLPKAKQAYDLLHESYKARRAAWPDVLTAQRMFLNLQAEQVNNLVLYRESDVAIRGLLLTGGLSTPPSPIGGGHIDAVPKPR